MRFLSRLLLSFMIALFAVQDAAPVHCPSCVVAITHVTVINPGTSSVSADQTVTMEGTQITSVTPSAKATIPNHARVIDAHGQYLMPGLWDMHVHSAFGDWFPGGREVILPLFIANGVTGVRDMGGDLPVLFEWRKQIAAGKLVGPRMVVSGPMLDGYLPGNKLRFPSSVPITTSESAVAAVDSLKAQGVDFVKVQSVISHDAYLAAAAEAHKQNLPIVGHVPDKVRISETISAGQKSIEHLMGILRRLLDRRRQVHPRGRQSETAPQHFRASRGATPSSGRSRNIRSGSVPLSRGSAAERFSINSTGSTNRSTNMSRPPGATSPGDASTTR